RERAGDRQQDPTDEQHAMPEDRQQADRADEDQRDHVHHDRADRGRHPTGRIRTAPDVVLRLVVATGCVLDAFPERSMALKELAILSLVRRDEAILIVRGEPLSNYLLDCKVHWWRPTIYKPLSIFLCTAIRGVG